jgi:hypothetical protein
MESIIPEIEGTQILIAERQPEYEPIVGVVAHNPHYGSAAVPGLRRENTIVVAFRPNEEERTRLLAGEDIYLQLLTFGGSMQPVLLTVGKAETAAMLRTGVK